MELIAVGVQHQSSHKRNSTALALVPDPQPTFASMRRISEMHYVVTGGAGFIGSNTVDELVRRDYQVTVFDDLSRGRRENLAGLNGKINFVQTH
jgi:NAD dependent epimerase/dehydratase family